VEELTDLVFLRWVQLVYLDLPDHRLKLVGEMSQFKQKTVISAQFKLAPQKTHNIIQFLRHFFDRL
jgi:hypothetical protein